MFDPATLKTALILAAFHFGLIALLWFLAAFDRWHRKYKHPPTQKRDP